MPTFDTETGLWNRAALIRLAAMFSSSARRLKQPLMVLAVNVDGADGDVIRGNVRAEDAVGAWADDMLVVLLQGTAIDVGLRVAERIKLSLGPQRSIRFGVAMSQPDEGSLALLERATRIARKTAAGGVTLATPSAAPKRPSGPLELGEMLGSYRLLHEISRGGMGIVYRAEDLALERPVAIKRLKTELAEDAVLVEQLRSEAALLARLRHPNLVQVYSFAHGDADAYIVMELVEGEAMAQAVERHRLEQTTMPLHQVIGTIEEVASALDELHDHGVIHRDVKPANVIRDPFRDRSVLVDVGIARRYGQTTETAGTPGFVAPEVIRGDEATPRSDVYGLAATAYAVLSLADPWGDTVGHADVLQRQAAGEPVPRLSISRPELAPIDALMQAALSGNPDDRPASPGLFARALSSALGPLAPVPPDAQRTRGRVILPKRARAMNAETRGVVFRSVSRALGAREADGLQEKLVLDHVDLARSLTEPEPMAWLPTELFVRLLAVTPGLIGREPAVFAKDLGRATIRASFRRFFPTVPATLVPARTLGAIRAVWSCYQTWGSVSSLQVHPTETVIRVVDTPAVAGLCAFAVGLLDQLVVLSGGAAAHVEHEACEARGDHVCLYRVSWEQPA